MLPTNVPMPPQRDMAFVAPLSFPKPQARISSPRHPQAALRVGIVGAGTAGAALAAHLRCLSDAEVSLFERRAPPQRGTGLGVQLRGTALDALEAAGLGDVVADLEAGGQKLLRTTVRRMDNEVLVPSGDAAASGTTRGFLIVRRGESVAALLHNFLRASAPSPTAPLPPGAGPVFQSGKSVVRVHESDSDVTLAFDDGSSWTGDVVVGADGLRSTVAPYVDPRRTLHFLGDRVWRGVARTGPAQHADGGDPSAVCGAGVMCVWARSSAGVFANAYDLGPCAPAPAGGDDEDEEAAARWTHWAVFERVESARGGDMPAHVLQQVAPCARALVAATPPAAVVQTLAYEVAPLSRYVSRRVALIGDAAHAMSSGAAWGMASGIEDAVALGRVLQNADATSCVAALQQYERERMSITQELQEISRTGRNREQKSEDVKE